MLMVVLRNLRSRPRSLDVGGVESTPPVAKLRFGDFCRRRFGDFRPELVLISNQETGGKNL